MRRTREGWTGYTRSRPTWAPQPPCLSPIREGRTCRISWRRPAESFFALSYRQVSIPGAERAPDQEEPEMTATSNRHDATRRVKIRETVREKYGDIARDVLQGAGEI